MKQHYLFSALMLATALAANAASAYAQAAGGGGDIIVFDIVDSSHDSGEASRPPGGGVGGDIIVFDIVDS